MLVVELLEGHSHDFAGVIGTHVDHSPEEVFSFIDVGRMVAHDLKDVGSVNDFDYIVVVDLLDDLAEDAGVFEVIVP